ncbi:glycine/D-amino acid oxidase-like deaminating enzyme [Saccharothrix tamanrassetensis]|uniref:Glycine/D-amino acid oxidase-like deaminating enzyme n=1 Tax=Saccharothrix tamanrassetensis TaxID=1051531 RepID=A0A841CKU6_9PSEU|nr:FAD-dependent oxidoreductase [Saccharothrix tamanrassetensis]MBB5958151.1 glycine/D-amino acid oxidase-like deaminating enzyme [Saccharothrix tamanrassetensis]
MKVGVVGGGLAGALLAWRLSEASDRVRVEVVVGRRTRPDASAVSGGLVRGFELDPGAGRVAAESLAELRGDDRLREWSGYREIGSLYVVPRGVDPAGSVRVVDERLPGSPAVVDAGELRRRFGFRDLADDAVGVVERHAGYLSPAKLRDSALARAADQGVDVVAADAVDVRDGPALRTSDGVERRYDALVVAAGAWTPGLVDHGGTLRTKQIQYGVYRVPLSGLGAFVDDDTGLYGRPWGDGTFLLGLGCDRWDVRPEAVEPDLALADRVAAGVRRRFGVAVGAAPPEKVVASFDCYRSPAGLRLLPVDGRPGLFTFTGGSGGAAKTAVVVSRRAAGELLTTL